MLIDVSGNVDTASLLEKVMDKEQLNWRSIAPREMIVSNWNAGVTPAYDLIDAEGTTRRRVNGNPGQSAIEKAVERCLDELK
ncbi:MAG: hypothetical protein NT069_00050 [Planctomycetota bacterium]|nr:hypothetical protein [Planctomycetota bacterium]